MITCVVDALFGSCGKGAVVGHIAGSFQVAVRVGAANAGHTVYVGGEKHVVQQLPVSAYANPDCQLVLGAGALISPEILLKEIETNAIWRRGRGLPELEVHVDYRAHAVTDYHKSKEQEWGLVETIGSTSATAREGIGAAQVARVKRSNYALAQEVLANKAGDYIVWCDTVRLLHEARTFGTPILLEGTQGTGLDNILGYQYPFVTSRGVTASALAHQCGFGPKDIDNVILVARTYPIRVAGNSGPFWPDSTEISWVDVGVDPEREKTTVTKKVRRVATFSYSQMVHAVQVNSATEIALTFCDYLAPQIAGQAGSVSASRCDGFDYLGTMIRRIEAESQCSITYLGTGPDTMLDREPDSYGVGDGQL